MKLVKPSWEIIEQSSGIEGVYNHIELAGRTAYRSENKITEGSAKPFVDRMINSNHGACLEHGTIYLKYPYSISNDLFVRTYSNNPYSKIHLSEDNNIAYISTNYRVLVENDWLDDLQYLCKPTEFHEKRITVKFTLARSTAMEFLRHRKFSFLMESTRYCNYSANKFGNELTFIQPSWYNENKLTIKPNIIHDNEGDLIGEYYFHLTGKEYSYFKPWKITPENNFFASLQFSEVLYLELLKQGWKAEQAREVLPNALKCDLIMTGFIEDWQHFFSLRALGATGKPHPSASELAIPLREEFIKRGYIK